jgi:hypothetical protein
MRHKRFNWRCPLCRETGLQPDPREVYKVRVCTGCTGRGRALLTVMQRLELDGARTAGGVFGEVKTGKEQERCKST